MVSISFAHNENSVTDSQQAPFPRLLRYRINGAQGTYFVQRMPSYDHGPLMVWKVKGELVHASDTLLSDKLASTASHFYLMVHLLPTKLYASHSFRTGGATAAAEALSRHWKDGRTTTLLYNLCILSLALIFQRSPICMVTASIS